MKKKPTQSHDAQPPASPPDSRARALQRNRMEFVRFPTKQDRLDALGIFWDVTSSEIHFTFRKDWPENTCITNTATVRELVKHGVNFEWLTENGYQSPSND
jgi:hypothetical protein